MREFFRESIPEDFSDGYVTVTKGDFLNGPITAVTLRRNDELDLVFELTLDGWSKEKPQRYPAGAVRAADEKIEFSHAAGWVGVAHGVIERGVRSHSNRVGQSETVETYSARSVEIDLQRQVQPSFVIEWVLNLPSGFIWSEPTRYKLIETFTKSVGTGDAEIRMSSSSEAGGGNKALHLRISRIDLYVMRSDDRSKNDKDAGQIVYRTYIDQAFRDKVRACLSFVLGSPIVYLGHTDYCSEWVPTFMKSVDAFSLDGAAFRLNDLPPYPINDSKYGNIINPKLVSDLVNALFDKFDDIKFNELSWSYWYAMSAPLHVAAIQLGSLIEQLQKNSNKITKTSAKVLDDETWSSLNSTILCWLKAANIHSDIRPILEGKISSLNQAPQNLALKRLLDALRLKVSDTEMKAWKHRNRAAHGGSLDNPIEIILNSKILRLLFHRLLAGVTGCSDRYIDYYNLGHPVRMLKDEVPGR